jgi:hypothetical protein
MPRDFSRVFGPCEGDEGIEEPQTALIIEDVENMALGEEVDEIKRERNRAMLASWGALSWEEDELRTMTWADFGFCYNIEPFRTDAVQTWVTARGSAADQWLDDQKMDMSEALFSTEVWKHAGAEPLPKYVGTLKG